MRAAARRSLKMVALVSFLGVLLITAVSAWRFVANNDMEYGEQATRRVRSFSIHSSNPSLTEAEVDRLIGAFDRVHAQLARAGVGDVSAYVHRRLAETDVSEAERIAFFQENSSLFGGRTYSQSRLVIDRLLRIRKVRAELEQREVFAGYP